MYRKITAEVRVALKMEGLSKRDKMLFKKMMVQKTKKRIILLFNLFNTLYQKQISTKEATNEIKIY